jgi:hypothetical protein
MVEAARFISLSGRCLADLLALRLKVEASLQNGTSLMWSDLSATSNRGYTDARQ